MEEEARRRPWIELEFEIEILERRNGWDRGRHLRVVGCEFERRREEWDEVERRFVVGLEGERVGFGSGVLEAMQKEEDKSASLESDGDR